MKWQDSIGATKCDSVFDFLGKTPMHTLKMNKHAWIIQRNSYGLHSIYRTAKNLKEYGLVEIIKMVSTGSGPMKTCDFNIHIKVLSPVTSNGNV